jgi:hypothetical protein
MEAASRQTKIEQADVGPSANRFLDRVLGVTDLGANDEPGSLEREPDPAADTESAFGDEHPWPGAARLCDDVCEAEWRGFERLRAGGGSPVDGFTARRCRPVDEVGAARGVFRRCNANRR